MTGRGSPALGAAAPAASSTKDARITRHLKSLRFHSVVLAAAAVIGLAFEASLAFAGNSTSTPAVYTKAQAQRGSKLYRDNCASCHGSNLQGDVGPALVGKQFQQMASAQNLSVKSLLVVTSVSMPKTDPGSLKASGYDAIIAFILEHNGYPAGPTKLTKTEPGLAAIRLAK